MSWPKVRLGDVALRSEESIFLQADSEYSEITVKLWGKGVILRGRVTGPAIAGSRRFCARAGQFILSRIDARNGAIGIVPQKLDGAVVTNDFPLFNLDSLRIDPVFLGWLGRTSGFVELCRHASEGTTNRIRLQETRFLRLEIPLPPLIEQQRVAERIEKFAGQINEAQSIRQEAIKEAHALSASMAASVLDRAGALHPTLPLIDLVTIRGGGTPSKLNPQYWQGAIPWVSPKDMKSRVIHDAIDHISEHAVQETPAKLIDPGAVLIVVRGMILAHTVPSAVLRSSAAINQDMKALIPRNEILPEFLCTALWAYNSRVLDLVEKSTHDTRKLETAKLLGFRIPAPPIEDQRKILLEFDAIQSQLNTVKVLQAETTVVLDAVLPALLDRAFAGQL